jgi:hypothetical protein
MASTQTEHPVPQHITDPDQIPGVETYDLPDIKIISHSPLLYWWPVWTLGFLFAILTRVQGDLHTIGGVQMYIHPSKNLGVIYTVVFMLVILFTNVTLRGWISVVAIVSIMFITVLFAYLGWWDVILAWVPLLSIHMNMGFYVFFSTFLFILWALAFFVFDRLEYWRVRPGLMTHEFVVGGAEASYDTRGMFVEQLRMDFFRNYLLGLGAGDMRVITTGARSAELKLDNVLFVNRKVRALQKLVAVKPTELIAQSE